MKLKDYLSIPENGRKILIVSDLAKGQKLIRKYEAATGSLVHNVQCMKMDQAVMQLYLYFESDNGFNAEKKIVDDTEALMILRNIIFSNISGLKFLNNSKMIDLATVREIWSKAGVIRQNGWTGEEIKSDSAKIDDLKFIIEKYEEYLINNNLADGIAILREVLGKLKESGISKEIIRDVFAAEFSYLNEETDTFSMIDKELLGILLGGEDRQVNAFDCEPDMDSLDFLKDKAEFFRGYGTFNEACYVANDILQKELPFGSVTVMFNSQNQLAAISAAFKGNGLPMRVVSKHPASDNPYVNLVRRIIDWAKDDFSEKAIKNVFMSPVLPGRNYFKYIENAAQRWNDKFYLGWGYERNLEFIEHESVRADAITDAKVKTNAKKFFEMFKELVEIFGANGKAYDDGNRVAPGVVYKKLIDFVKNNTSVFSKEDYAGMEALIELTKAVDYDNRLLPLAEILEFIEVILENVSVSDTVSGDAVEIKKISGWDVPDRENLYVIGLSLKDTQGVTVESPILTDSEMEKYIAGGYKPTTCNINELIGKNLYRTMKSFTGEHIVFGFSSYDTVGFCENNPSGFYREAVMRFKNLEIKDLPEFVYGNPASPVIIDKTDVKIPQSSEKADKEDGDTSEESEESVYDFGEYISQKDENVKWETSPTVLEELLDCPKKFAFDKILRIPGNEFFEKNYSEWLKPTERGNFFHAVAQKYVTEILVKPYGIPYAQSADENVLSRIAHEIRDEIRKVIPAAIPELTDKMTEEIKDAAKVYFDGLHEQLNSEGWRCLFAEQRFEKAEISVESYLNEQFNFSFSGVIDRIDYRVDTENKTVYMKIADYKTGKQDSKEKEKNLGKLIQYSIYYEGLMKSGKYINPQDRAEIPMLDYVKQKIAELNIDENGNTVVEDLDNYNYEFESFNYVFPMDNKSTGPFTINFEADGINFARLKAVLTCITDTKAYPDHLNLYKAVEEYKDPERYGQMDPKLSELYDAMTPPAGLKKENEENKNCKYCAYGDLCTNRKAGVIK